MINRISKVIWNMDESQYGINIQASQTMQIAADCLREALLECDVPE